MHPKADVNNDPTCLIALLLNVMGNKYRRSFHFKRLVLITLEEIDVRKLDKFQIILEICVIVIPRFIESLKPAFLLFRLANTFLKSVPGGFSHTF